MVILDASHLLGSLAPKGQLGPQIRRNEYFRHEQLI